MTAGNTGFKYETGEEKSSSYAHSAESGHSSHKTYTRVSGPGGVALLPQVPGAPAVAEIERGRAVVNAAQSGVQSAASHSQSGSSFSRDSPANGQPDSRFDVGNSRGQPSSGSYDGAGFSFDAEAYVFVNPSRNQDQGNRS